MKTLKDLSAKEKRWLLATVSVACVAAAYVWVLEPLMSHASGTGQKLESKKTAFQKSLKNMALYESGNAEYARLAERLPGMSGKEDITGSLGDLEKIAGESSVSIASIKPQTFEEEDGSKRVLFEISASADAPSFARFLYRLETSPQLLRVKRFSVMPGTQSSGGLQCTLLVSQLAVS